MNPQPEAALGAVVPRPAHTPFRSFWMGGFEGADHLNLHGEALDMPRSSGHVDRLGEDYAGAAAHGLRTVRESLGWRRTEARRGQRDFGRALAMTRAARHHGIQIVWSLMHYGTPADVSLLDDDVIPRLAEFAAATAAALAPWHDDACPPVYNPINEIGFVAWAATATGLLHPYGPHTRAPGDTRDHGYLLKRRLVRAALAARQAILAVDPRARFLHIEPVVHVVAPAGQPELAPLARQISAYQWQAWDMIAGREAPELGGTPAALDLIGVNHYHNGQWEAVTGQPLHWHLYDPRRRPLSALLRETWDRYERPLILAETGHVGAGRALWLADVAAEVHQARREGVPVEGMCLYPLVDRHDWNDANHWHHSGLWDIAEPAGAPPTLIRHLHAAYADELARWQALLPHRSDPADLQGTS
ncbi:MAG: hypothetical protein REI09_14360 [Candidatus Dactylopiibacterium sp.]|nr:hypothetical protein [Candidatus Dactylopiibacterium sp.]